MKRVKERKQKLKPKNLLSTKRAHNSATRRNLFAHLLNLMLRILKTKRLKLNPILNQQNKKKEKVKKKR